MPLKQEFEEAIEAALERRKKRGAGDDAARPFLHQAIAGPPNSGKSYLARQYIRALVENGMVEDKVHEFYFPGKFMQETTHTAARAKGGVLLIDDINSLPTVNTHERNALRELAEIIIRNECTVVMLCAEDTLRHFMDDEGIKRRMNRPVILKQEDDIALPHPIHVKSALKLKKPEGT